MIISNMKRKRNKIDWKIMKGKKDRDNKENKERKTINEWKTGKKQIS